MRHLILLTAMLGACTGPATPPDTDDTDDTDVATPPPPTPLGDPEAAGPNTVELFFDDIPAGDDTLAVRAHVPDTDLGPVALIFPGFLFSPEQYDSYAQHLASHGYVGLVVNIPGGIGENRKTHAEQAEFVGHALNWLEGQSTGRLAGIDPYNTYVVGHSLGGKLSLLRATTDARITAIVALDPVDASPFDDPVAYPSVTPELMGQITIPVAYLGETNNDQGCAPEAQNFDAYYTSAAGPALEVQFTQANHVSWLGNPDCGALCDVCGPGTGDANEHIATKTVTNGIIYSFFEHVRVERPGARDHFTTLTDAVGAGTVTVESKNGL